MTYMFIDSNLYSPDDSLEVPPGVHFQLVYARPQYVEPKSPPVVRDHAMEVRERESRLAL